MRQVGTEVEKKLTQLREIIKKQELAGYLQPVHDEYMSEYPPACHQRVAWLTGFTGSAGMVAVLKDKAALFVDGRYTLQAKQQTDSTLYEQHNSGELTPENWLVRQMPVGGVLGYDARLFTRSMLSRMQGVLAKRQITLRPVANLVDTVWKDRPAAPASAVSVHPVKYAGESVADKRKRIAAQVREAGADACVLSAPDAVNWLLNIRGCDVECTPLALSVAIIDAEGRVQLYIEPKRCGAAVRTALGRQVTLRAPSSLEEDLRALGQQNASVLCDPQSLPVWFTQVLQEAGAVIIDGADPCLLPKAMKNDTELKGIRAAHIRDGAAVVKLLCWLDKETAGRNVMEMEISDRLLDFRCESELFVEPSFPSITGSGPNGAIVHYRVTEKSNRTLKKGELFLLDSGGQYPDGTTDITRTMPVGKPSREHKDRFTRVLKGHIALALARFPRGTSGSQLDALARQYLWQAGLDYDHGTGHGVGQFLSVHEGPQRISKRGGDAALAPGMVISNEPGYYKTGAYGIRIENLVAVAERDKSWLGFETLTCVPIDTRLVDAAMLTKEEKQWLNRYHAWVKKMLSPLLNVSEKAWLKARCRAV